MKYENKEKIERMKEIERKKDEDFRWKCRMYHESESFSEFMLKLDNVGKGYGFCLLNPFWWHYRQKNSCDGFLGHLFLGGVGFAIILSVLSKWMGLVSASHLIPFVYLPIMVPLLFTCVFIEVSVIGNIDMELIRVKHEN